jgi:multidrug efflux pump
VFGPNKLETYNGVNAVELTAGAMPGHSTGEVMAALEEIAESLPPGVDLVFTGLSYEERKTGSTTYLLYALSILAVFLCLAALYESWKVPIAVLMVLPLGIIGAVVAVYFRGFTNDIFFQVGLLTTIGLSAKNAILIVEFAKVLHEKDGKSLFDSAIEAARLRLRPIIMTSLAFTFGVLPMALATGAGQGSQQAIGTAVVGGMMTATFLAIFFIPLFFVVVYGLGKKPS